MSNPTGESFSPIDRDETHYSYVGKEGDSQALNDITAAFNGIRTETSPDPKDAINATEYAKKLDPNVTKVHNFPERAEPILSDEEIKKHAELGFEGLRAKIRDSRRAVLKSSPKP